MGSTLEITLGVGVLLTELALWKEGTRERVIERIKAQGGEVVKAPYPEGNLRVATFRDPAGNVIGLWQEGSH